MSNKKENASAKDDEVKVNQKENKFNDEPQTVEEAETVVSETETDKELEALKEENKKLKDSFLRAYAEAENTKKRCQQEIEKNSKFAVSSFAKELLSVADNLQRALSAADEKTKEQCNALISGVEMTQKELVRVFEKFGIKKIDSLDKVFDPNFERVVQEVENADKPAGTVIAELQSAYTLNDRILREAMVIVTKGGK
jgi:molecular chaperone GrpE